MKIAIILLICAQVFLVTSHSNQNHPPGSICMHDEIKADLIKRGLEKSSEQLEKEDKIKKSMRSSRRKLAARINEGAAH